MKNPLIVQGDTIYKRSKNVKYHRNCNTCGKEYIGWGKFYCRKKCRQIGKMENHPSWKGDKANPKTGHGRAWKMFKLEPCEVCGSKKSERHHIDSNPLNNVRENIMFLCRKHHIATEDRLVKMLSIRHPGVQIVRHQSSI